MNWELLLDEDALALLLPGEYARFARPVKEGLVVFLGGLPQAIQKSIFSEQASLSAETPFAERLGRLARSCPVLHKLGQILARNRRLAPELRHQFRQLESLPPTVCLEVIQDILARELGPLDRRAITLLPPAIAEASVAVVIPFQQYSGPQAQEGVFKILKPGIEERLGLELELLGRVGSHLDQECDRLQIPPMDYAETFEQVRRKLANEVLLEQEQRHLVEAREFYAGQPDVLIPRVMDHCTSRITAMERVVGEKVTDHLFRCPRKKRQLANLVSRTLVAQPLFSRSSRALFHSDPHAGNLLSTNDGRLAVLDWSLVGHLGEKQRVAIGQILLGALTLQAEKIVAEVEDLAEGRIVDRCSLVKVVMDGLQRVRRGQFPGVSWLVGMLDEAARFAGLRVASDMLLFRKSLLTLEGVVSEIGAEGHWVDDVAVAEFFHHFACELPTRCFLPPTSRKFATRLSNSDLWNAWLSLPLTTLRYWLAELDDFLQNRSSPLSARG